MGNEFYGWKCTSPCLPTGPRTSDRVTEGFMVAIVPLLCSQELAAPHSARKRSFLPLPLLNAGYRSTRRAHGRPCAPGASRLQHPDPWVHGPGVEPGSGFHFCTRRPAPGLAYSRCLINLGKRTQRQQSRNVNCQSEAERRVRRRWVRAAQGGRGGS